MMLAESQLQYAQLRTCVHKGRTRKQEESNNIGRKGDKDVANNHLITSHHKMQDRHMRYIELDRA
eukprot:5720233-Karenia_brevis.AAC.1